MRLATIRFDGSTRAARIEGETAVLLLARDVAEVLASTTAVAEDGRTVPFRGADLAPLVLRPGKIICVGLNYRTHLEELGVKTPSHPTLFNKFASSLIGAHDDLVHPSVTEKLDWEVELTAVIGRRVFRAELDEAEAAIAGYTVGNDVTMRDWQMRTMQWLQGKAVDGTTPVGPVLVTPDEIDGARSLEIRCEVDGEVVQRSNTADLLFSPADLVAYTSQFASLEPGDLIMTGTPAGVGDMMKPPRFLEAGQTLRTVVEGIGECVNLVVTEGSKPDA